MAQGDGARVWPALAAAAIALTAVAAAQQADKQPAPASRSFVLLVGVTEFIAPAMQKHNLQGPANDVALFRSVLTSQAFQVSAAAIVSLAGLPGDDAARPTRANIEREFRRLRDLAGPGDQVLVLLAGHGSQQPADPDPMDEEPDGLDEIFLPADASGWDPSSSRVTNAIVDDEIRQWVGAIRAKGATVSIVVDACHSGTITRTGASERRERSIPVEALVPSAALASARGNVTRSALRAQSGAFEFSDTTGDIAALYAADVIEGTPELPMPDRGGPVHGLFTYTLARVLMDHAEPLTYRELVQRVIDRYRAGGFGPTPSYEGAGVDREVLGQRAVRDHAFTIEARRSDDTWLLAGGSIHGLTRGSILEVLPPAGSGRAAKPLGHVRVVELRPTTALARAIRYEGKPAPTGADVAAGSRARVKYHEFGALQLGVALRSPPRGLAALELALSSVESLSQGLAARASPRDADWLLGVEANRVILTPADGQAGASPPDVAAGQTRKRFDVGALDDTALAFSLADRLKRIARAANLTRLSSYVDPEAALKIQVIRYETGAVTATPLLASGGAPAVKAGERLQFIVRNTGTLPLDVTMLYIDANAGIWPLFPLTDRELDNRIDPGRDRALEPVEITADPLGWESVIAIGVESTPRHENFRQLAQESLPDARAPSAGPPSALRALLESAVSGTRSVAGRGPEDRGRFALTQTWFRVDPATIVR